MPADVNKSINISVKADMKNAINNIKSLPNVTAKEAAAMRKTLKREFKEAEKAAKKAEVAQKKAMQTTAREAKKAAAETRALKRQTAELGGAVSAAVICWVKCHLNLEDLPPQQELLVLQFVTLERRSLL